MLMTARHSRISFVGRELAGLCVCCAELLLDWFMFIPCGLVLSLLYFQFWIVGNAMS